MDKTLEYLQCNNEVCDIQILDNMTEIKELLEEYKFRIIDTSGKDDDGICAIRYLKKLK